MKKAGCQQVFVGHLMEGRNFIKLSYFTAL